MGPEQYLDYEVTLLLAKHGEKHVLSALATKLGLTTEELQLTLEALKTRRPRTIKARKPIDPSRTIESIILEHPEKATSLRLLYSRFQNRTFLPELKDVKRFFDRHSRKTPPPPLRSRIQSTFGLFRLLAEMDAEALEDLCHDSETVERSDLGIISDAIMMRNR